MAADKQQVNATLVAAITAAVAVLMDRAPESIQVRSVRLLGPATETVLWSLTGRQAQMAARRLSMYRKGSH